MKIIFFFFFIFLTACSSTKEVPRYSSDIKKEKGMPVHGNFCGKNIPTINTQEVNERINILKRIKAIDVIDLACKNHDLCYAREGYYEPKCDKQFLETITKITTLKSRSCGALLATMANYFATPINDNIVNKVIRSYNSAGSLVTSSVVNTATKTVGGVLVGVLGVTFASIDALEGKSFKEVLSRTGKAIKELSKSKQYNFLPNRYESCDGKAFAFQWRTFK